MQTDCHRRLHHWVFGCLWTSEDISYLRCAVNLPLMIMKNLQKHKFIVCKREDLSFFYLSFGVSSNQRSGLFLGGLHQWNSIGTRVSLLHPFMTVNCFFFRNKISFRGFLSQTLIDDSFSFFLLLFISCFSQAGFCPDSRLPCGGLLGFCWLGTCASRWSGLSQPPHSHPLLPLSGVFDGSPRCLVSALSWTC